MFSVQLHPPPLDKKNCGEFFPTNYTRLTDEQKNSCEGLIMEEELHKSIMSFKTGKTPGLNGLPIEIYQSFYEQIKNPLLTCLNYAYDKGNLSGTQQESIITLLLKQEPNGQYKDPVQLKNWRPLTLQCCDAKILAKCIALRIKKIIPFIIHEDQSGFIEGRNIANNIRQMLEIIEHYNKVSKPGLICIADFEKAFDKLRWDFIYKCLDFFNFGESLKKWIKVIYKNSRSKVINNGHISKEIPLSRGVKQGCPLSPYLFIIAIEILAIKIRRNNAIKGLGVNGLTSKISMYADDTNFLITEQNTSLQNLTIDLDAFSNISGLKPNYDKCKILRIGSLKKSDFTLSTNIPISWTDGPVKVLGIQIPENINEISEINFNSKLEKIEKILMPWKGNYLTIYGKITIINSLVVSQFTHLLIALPSPKEHLFKLFEQKIFKFIWNNKPDKIKRAYLYNEYEVGGFKLLNLKALNFSLKASLIQKYYLNPNWFTSKLIKRIHPIFENNLFPFIQMNPYHFLHIKYIFSKLSTFFEEALKSWLHFQFYPPENTEEYLQQIIWLNANIKIDGAPFCWKSMMDKGIIFLNDIINTENNLMKYKQLINTYGNVCTMQMYNQLRGAIPHSWKQKIKKNKKTEIHSVCRPHIKKLKWLKGKNKKKRYI